MRRRAPWVAAAVVGVLAVGAVVVDGRVRAETEEQIAAGLQQQIPGLDAPPEVEIAGTPFLTQVAVGELGRVDVTAPALVLDNGLVVTDVVARLEGVSTTTPTTARTLHLEGDVAIEQLVAMLDVPADVTVENGAFVVRATLLVLEVEAVLVPRAEGDRVAIDVDSVSVGGASVRPENLPGGIGDRLTGLSVPVEGLPEGVGLTRVTLTNQVAHLVAEGDDVVLDAAG